MTNVYVVRDDCEEYGDGDILAVFVNPILAEMLCNRHGMDWTKHVQTWEVRTELPIATEELILSGAVCNRVPKGAWHEEVRRHTPGILDGSPVPCQWQIDDHHHMGGPTGEKVWYLNVHGTDHALVRQTFEEKKRELLQQLPYQDWMRTSNPYNVSASVGYEGTVDEHP